MAYQQPARGGTNTGGREIPDKLYFRIGEVALLCEVAPHVLRFWEGEFPQLKPNKGGTGQRLYRRRDVEMAMRIKALLYDEGYTIPGARQAIRTEARRKEPLLLSAIEETPGRTALKRLRRDMQDLLSLLSSPVGSKQKSAPVQPIRGSRHRQSVPNPDTQNLFDEPF